tara:strand:- start:431 stop:1522 length:1092 start_codon:yes stop_codon:yes gene_type:complete
MFHLYKNIYLETDLNVDPNKNRCVYSKKFGVPMLNEFSHLAFQGTLHNYNLDVNSEMFMTSLLNYAKNEEFYIFADDPCLAKIFATWLNFILPNITEDGAVLLYKSLIFQKNVTKQVSSWHNGTGDNDMSILENEFRNDFKTFSFSDNERDGRFAYVKEQHDEHPSIEYVIPTYIVTGKMQKLLSNTIQILLKKLAEEYLVELKIEFMTRFNRFNFSDKAELEQRYDLHNIEDIFNDRSPIGEFFLSDRIFGSKHVLKPSGHGFNIMFFNIVDADLIVLEKYLEGVGQPKEFFTILKKYLLNLNYGFSKIELDDFLNDEAYTSDGIFTNSIFSNTGDTINKYFINYVLNRIDEPEKIREFSLV